MAAAENSLWIEQETLGGALELNKQLPFARAQYGNHIIEQGDAASSPDCGKYLKFATFLECRATSPPCRNSWKTLAHLIQMRESRRSYSRYRRLTPSCSCCILSKCIATAGSEESRVARNQNTDTHFEMCVENKLHTLEDFGFKVVESRTGELGIARGLYRLQEATRVIGFKGELLEIVCRPVVRGWWVLAENRTAMTDYVAKCINLKIVL